jgi:hypothetical protein
VVVTKADWPPPGPRPGQPRHELSDGLDPDLFAAFADTLALIGIVCAAAEFSPNPVGGLHEHRVILSADFLKRKFAPEEDW